jgi:hypothetical protein
MPRTAHLAAVQVTASALQLRGSRIFLHRSIAVGLFPALILVGGVFNRVAFASR